MGYRYLLIFPSADFYVEVRNMEAALDLLSGLMKKGMIDFVMFDLGGNHGIRGASYSSDFYFSPS